MTTTILQPSSAGGIDCDISSNNPTSNYGAPDNQAYLRVADDTDNLQSLIKFTINPFYVPNGAIVTSAILELYCYYISVAGTRTVGVFKNTSSWSEPSVTWNTKPTHDASAFTSLAISTTGAKTFDITSLVAGWVNGSITNYGVTLALTDAGTASARYFRSSDHATASERPKLTITYHLPSAAVNIGGVWKDYADGWVNIGGAWKQIDTISVNIGGTWKT